MALTGGGCGYHVSGHADMLPKTIKTIAVPAFNISSNMLLSGVIEASEEKQSPLILAIHPDELSFVRPAFIKSAVEEATKATIPVCIHLDHGDYAWWGRSTSVIR